MDLHVGGVLASCVLRSDGAVPDVGVLGVPLDLCASGSTHASLREEALQVGPDVAVGARAPRLPPCVDLPIYDLVEHAQCACVVDSEVQRPGSEVCPDYGPCLHSGGGQGWAIELAPEYESYCAAFGPV